MACSLLATQQQYDLGNSDSEMCLTGHVCGTLRRSCQKTGTWYRCRGSNLQKGPRASLGRPVRKTLKKTPVPFAFAVAET